MNVYFNMFLTAVKNFNSENEAINTKNLKVKLLSFYTCTFY